MGAAFTQGVHQPPCTNQAVGGRAFASGRDAILPSPGPLGAGYELEPLTALVHSIGARFKLGGGGHWPDLLGRNIGTC